MHTYPGVHWCFVAGSGHSYPAGHGEHTTEPSGENCPIAQSTGGFAGSKQLFPAGHTVQFVLAVSEKPPEQAIGVVATEGQAAPAGQGRQFSSPPSA